MVSLKEQYQEADWKLEKHVPVIEVVIEEEVTVVTVTVGKQVPHPNTTEHHIKWIEIYFLPDGEKFPYQIGRFEFTAHGESIKGPNTSGIFSDPFVSFYFVNNKKKGTILASSYCNIHGLWENSIKLD